MTKMMDGLLGLAIGDALGVPVEFVDRNYLKINKVTDMEGYGSHQVPKGTWSDDTSMTIATLDSINEKKTVDYEDIMKKFAEWYCDSKYTATGVFFDIGISTKKSIEKYLHGISPLQCGGDKEFENGNGSLMRIFPIVCYCIDMNFDDETSTKIINEASSLTHAHNISKMACKMYYDIVKGLMNSESLVEVVRQLKKEQYLEYYDLASVNKFDRILSGNIFSCDEQAISSSGYVVNSLEAALWCLIKTRSYKEAVIKAVNLGDDTDTVAAITGSLAGVLYGIDDIPKQWINDLINVDYLINLSNSYEKLINSKSEDIGGKRI